MNWVGKGKRSELGRVYDIGEVSLLAFTSGHYTHSAFLWHRRVGKWDRMHLLAHCLLWYASTFELHVQMAECADCRIEDMSS